MKKETACGDSVLTGLNVSAQYRLDDLLMRRRLAALAGQHRTVQRYTKKLRIFCAAFGLDPAIADAEPKKNADVDTNHIYNHRVARDPGADVDMQLASYDTKWIRGQTTRSLNALANTLNSRGYYHERSTVDGVTTWKFSRANRVIELSLIGGSMWCASASINGKRLPLFDFQESADNSIVRGIPPEIARVDWDGKISAKDAQQYSVSWARLIDEAEK